MRKKPASFVARAAFVALAALCAAGAFIGSAPQKALAVETAGTPSPASFSAGETSTGATVAHGMLPIDSSLFLVLDGTISSRGQSGTVVQAHLRDPILIDGTTVAPAHAPVELSIVNVSRALMGNVDGWVQVAVRPLHLADGQTLPVHLPRSHIDRYVSVEQANRQETTDTIGDIFIPYHILYHAFRKGSDITLGPGTVLRARTEAAVSVHRKTVVVTTPPPLPTSNDAPYSLFSPTPIFTPRGFIPPAPKPSPKPTATPTP